MDKINQILSDIGLTQTESTIYLIGLSYVSVGVNELEKQTNIKRTTIYHALDTLMQKGLVAKKETVGRLAFSMTKPENIEKLLDQRIIMLQEQKKALADIVQLLDQRAEQKETKINVSHFEGIEGVKLVVEEALYCQSRHWDIIAPAKNFFSEFNAEYARYFIETRKKRNITARSLWEKDFIERRALTPEEIKQRSPRCLPEIMHGKFKSVIILFDDKIALISSLKEVSAILIKSQEIYNTFLTLFDGLWSVSKDYLQVKDPDQTK